MRTITKYDRVRFRTAINGKVKEVEGVVKEFIPCHLAKKQGLTNTGRTSGTVLGIDVEINEGWKPRRIYRHRSLVKKVEA